MEKDNLLKLELAIKNGFTYDPITGLINTPTGKIARKVSVNGYVLLTIRDENKKSFYVSGHQFAWYFIYKERAKCIDHINRIKTDNRIDNLRSVTKSENGMNRNIEKGYSFCKRSNKYISSIMINYKKKHLGSFETKEDARNCYLKNKEKYHSIKLN